jgi:4-hydroxy-tetrahydrodipicolinate synthase
VVFDFSGIWVPLVTPFAQGAIDHGALRGLVERLEAAGVAGVVVCGSTGEAALLSEREQRAVLDTVLAARHALPVLMGLGGVAPLALRDELLRWAERPLQGFLVAPPAYVRPSQAGVIDYFHTLADASPLPLVLYDIPARTGTRIERATALVLAAHPRIAAIKDCGGSEADTQALIDDGRLQVLAGDDARIFDTLCHGGHGAIAASAHLRPDLFVRLHRRLRAGELLPARALWSALRPWIELAFADPNPAVIKAALASLGHLADEVRAPMTLARAPTRERLAAVLHALQAVS